MHHCTAGGWGSRLDMTSSTPTDIGVETMTRSCGRFSSELPNPAWSAVGWAKFSAKWLSCGTSAA